MKNVINDILQIEDKANNILEEGRTEVRQLEQQLKEDIAKKEKDIYEMVQAKLRQLDQEEKKAAAESMKRINNTAKTRLKAMEGLYEDNREKWIDAVYNMITGSDQSDS